MTLVTLKLLVIWSAKGDMTSCLGSISVTINFGGHSTFTFQMMSCPWPRIFCIVMAHECVISSFFTSILPDTSLLDEINTNKQKHMKETQNNAKTQDSINKIS